MKGGVDSPFNQRTVKADRVKALKASFEASSTMPVRPLWCFADIPPDCSFQVQFREDGSVDNAFAHNAGQLRDALRAGTAKIHVLGGQHTVQALLELWETRRPEFKRFEQLPCLIVAVSSVADAHVSLLHASAEHNIVSASAVRVLMVASHPYFLPA